MPCFRFASHTRSREDRRGADLQSSALTPIFGPFQCGQWLTGGGNPGGSVRPSAFFMNASRASSRHSTVVEIAYRLPFLPLSDAETASRRSVSLSDSCVNGIFGWLILSVGPVRSPARLLGQTALPPSPIGSTELSLNWWHPAQVCVRIRSITFSGVRAPPGRAIARAFLCW
jgi:hypothetical protein